MNLLSDTVAVILGGMFLAIGFAYFTADPAVEAYCKSISSNPVDSTGCIIRTTVQSW